MKNPKTRPKLLFSLVLVSGFFLAPHLGFGLAKNQAPDVRRSTNGVTFETLDGRLLKIEGKFYIVEDFSGKQHRLQLSKHATLLRGPKKPGDVVRVEIIDARALTIE